MSQNLVRLQDALRSKLPPLQRLSGGREYPALDIISNQEAIDEFTAYAQDKFPEEACGLIVAGKFVPTKNVHPEPLNHFRISGEDWVQRVASGDVQAVLHSHTRSNNGPSANDMRGQMATDMLWGIATFHADGSYMDFTWFGDHAECPPLIGRRFRHGVTDCYAVIRHYHYHVLGNLLMDIPRDAEWWMKEKHDNLYETHFARAGFTIVQEDELQIGDCPLMAIYPGNYEGPRHANHAAVILGPNEILHHLWNAPTRATHRLSRRDVLQPWQGFVTDYVRFGGN